MVDRQRGQALRNYLPAIVLASASPARKVLLSDCGIDVTVVVTNTDERQQGTTPGEMVRAIAVSKMESYLHQLNAALPVVTCDTMISFGGRMIGKATSVEEARMQLSSFSNNTHEVVTGWALALQSLPEGAAARLSSYGTTLCEIAGHLVISGYDTAHVVFRNLSPQCIQDYLDCGEWKGAAGSYRIQLGGKELVDHIEGDWATVVGLPISQISAIMEVLLASGSAEYPPYGVRNR